MALTDSIPFMFTQPISICVGALFGFKVVGIVGVASGFMGQTIKHLDTNILQGFNLPWVIGH